MAPIFYNRHAPQKKAPAIKFTGFVTRDPIARVEFVILALAGLAFGVVLTLAINGWL